MSFFFFLTWGIYSFAHCDNGTWPIMEDIKLISLGSETWLREFEIVTHILMIRAIPYSLPHLDLVIHPLWALHSITPLLPNLSIILALHSIITYSFYPSIIRPGGVLGDWAWDEFDMMKVGLWWESGLIVWWEFMWRSLHMTLESCHDYRDWSSMMRVGLW